MRPMLATPTTAPPQGDAWRHEIKWDGIRAIVTIQHGRVTVTTRAGNDCTERFPELAESHLRDFDDLVLDGEIIALTEGLPDFRAVMHRLSPGRFRARGNSLEAAERHTLEGADIQFIAFDVLRAAGHDVTRLPWQARRELLQGADLEHGAVLVPHTHDDGQALFDATAAQGLEGVVSKRIDAPYRPGIRSEEWLKCVHRRSDSFVVGGWRPLVGTSGRVGAILLGQHHENSLRFRGRVGTGISASMSAALLDVVVPSPLCPFTDPATALSAEDLEGTHWVKPTIVVEVTYLGETGEGRLRQPSYKGLRLDLGASHV